MLRRLRSVRASGRPPRSADGLVGSAPVASVEGTTTIAVAGMREPGTTDAVALLSSMGLEVVEESPPSSLEEAGSDRWVLVYRAPWDVSDALQRSGSEAFLRRPEDAPALWSSEARRLLELRRRHPDRCVLVSLRSLHAEREAVAELLSSKLGVVVDEVPTDADRAPTLDGVGADDPLPRLFLAAFPETLPMLRALEAAADFPMRETDLVGPDGAGPELRPRVGERTGDADEAVVAVVVPCRDHGPQLIEAIASVERSITVPYELLVIDDGSTCPVTIAILDRLAEGGYRIERRDPEGVCAARNRGFELARARYVVPLDADNLLRPGPFLERALAALEADPRLGVVYGDREEFGLRRGRVTVAELDLPKLLRSNYIDTCVVLRRATWSDVGGYDEAIAGWEDWELWIRVARRGWTFRRLDEVAFDYRVRPDSLVTKLEDPRVAEVTLDRIVANHRDLFEQHLVDRLGHAVATWARRSIEERDRLRALVSSLTSEPLGHGSGTPRSVEDDLETLQARPPEPFELARARLAVLEARHAAAEATWRLEHAKASAERYQESSRQLQDNLAAREEVVSLQQALLDEIRSRAELAEAAYRTVQDEAAVREEQLQRLDEAHREAQREIERLRRSSDEVVSDRPG